MSDRDLGVEVTHDADVIVVTVRGELDLSTAPMLGTTLEQFGPGKRVVLKMSDVEFIDPTSLTVVLAHETYGWLKAVARYVSASPRRRYAGCSNSRTLIT